MSRRRAKRALAEAIRAIQHECLSLQLDLALLEHERPGERELRKGLFAVCEETAPVMARMGRA